MDGLRRTAPTLHLKEMKAAHGILPHSILKVAVPLFNMARTDINAALFANVEAGHSWPFVKDWVAPGEALQHLSVLLALFFMLLSIVLKLLTLTRKLSTF